MESLFVREVVHIKAIRKLKWVNRIEIEVHFRPKLRHQLDNLSDLGQWDDVSHAATIRSEMTI